MRQDFSGVTPEQLAALFPIVLERYRSAWPERYEEEAGRIRELFGSDQVRRITHIGSTSVPGLLAKPTVDLLAEVSETLDLSLLSETMQEQGYVVNTPPEDLVLYIKGYTPQGFQGQAYHIHVRHGGDWGEPYFRDVLIARPEVAREYERLKMRLREQFPCDRDGYTAAKGAFVRKYTAMGRKLFPGRYAPDEIR